MCIDLRFVYTFYCELLGTCFIKEIVDNAHSDPKFESSNGHSDPKVERSPVKIEENLANFFFKQNNCFAVVKCISRALSKVFVVIDGVTTTSEAFIKSAICL